MDISYRIGKKISILVAHCLSALSLWAGFVVAAEPLEIIVPTPPGGAVDMTARSLSKSLANNGYVNIVLYHPGANGDIALTKTLEKSRNSLLVASSANFVFSHLVMNRDNIHARDLHLLGPSVSNAMAFYSPLNKNIETLQDLISRARNENLPCATSNSHGEIELRNMNHRYGTKFLPVPYKGTGQLIPDLIGGHVTCAYDQIAPYTQLQNKVNFLATSGKENFKLNVALINGVLPGYAFTTWYAIGLPKNSPWLNDKRFVNALHWTQDRELANEMQERSFVIETLDPNLNSRAVKETLHYRNILK